MHPIGRAQANQKQTDDSCSETLVALFGCRQRLPDTLDLLDQIIFTLCVAGFLYGMRYAKVIGLEHINELHVLAAIVFALEKSSASYRF